MTVKEFCIVICSRKTQKITQVYVMKIARVYVKLKLVLKA